MDKIFTRDVFFDFLSSFPLAEMVCRAGRLIKKHIGFLDVSRIAFPADVIVNDIVIHMVHRTILLFGGAFD